MWLHLTSKHSNNTVRDTGVLVQFAQASEKCLAQIEGSEVACREHSGTSVRRAMVNGPHQALQLLWTSTFPTCRVSFSSFISRDLFSSSSLLRSASSSSIFSLEKKGKLIDTVSLHSPTTNNQVKHEITSSIRLFLYLVPQSRTTEAVKTWLKDTSLYDENIICKSILKIDNFNIKQIQLRYFLNHRLSLDDHV